MHLSVRLPKVEPLHIEPPTHCPLPDPKNPKKKCNGTHFKEHQLHCDKPIRDTRHQHVTARRYRCLKCQRTFRVYPTGVSHDQQSDTLKGLSVLLYVLGLSYTKRALKFSLTPTDDFIVGLNSWSMLKRADSSVL